MNTPLVHLTLDQVLAVHRRVIEEFGGDPEVRDRGLLESAIGMPAASFGGRPLHPGPATQAAAYLFHLSKNHPFVDGNKRTALAVAEIFLRLNGHRLDATDQELVDLPLGVTAGTTSKQDVTAFFQQRVSAC